MFKLTITDAAGRKTVAYYPKMTAGYWFDVEDAIQRGDTVDRTFDHDAKPMMDHDMVYLAIAG